MSLYKRFALRGLLAGAIVTAVLGVGALVANTKKVQAGSIADCDSNAVIYCGVLTPQELKDKYLNDGDASHHYTDLHAVYKHFGIMGDAVLNAASHPVIGQVHSDGTVWLNGQLIGTGAMTAGRTNLPGSTPVAGTGVFERAPSVSFKQSSLDAYIIFDDKGVAQAAILGACGNPVSFKHPHVNINKQVQNPASGNYVKEAVVDNGGKANYSLAISNDGQAPGANTIVRDFLPQNQTYVKGSTTVNGQSIGDGVTGNGINIGTVAVGQVVRVNFSALVNLPSDKCGTAKMTNIGAAAPINGPSAVSTAQVDTDIKCVSQCVSLTASNYDLEVGQKVTFTTNYIALGVKAVRFGFSVNGKLVQDNGSNTYVFTADKTGDYTISGTVRFSDGSLSGGTGACVKKVTVHSPKPVISCDSLDESKRVVQANETVTFTAHGSAKNAKILSYNFKVDGVSKQNKATNVYKFKTNKDGTYTVQVIVHTDQGDATSKACVKKITVQTKKQPVVSCDLLSLSANSITVGQSVTATTSFTAVNGATFKQATYTFGDETSTDQKTVTNKLDSNGHVVAIHTYNQTNNYTISVDLQFNVSDKVVTVTDAQQCVAKLTVGQVQAAATPGELPNTGAGNIAGIFAATTVAGALVHKYLLSRKLFGKV